MKPEKHALIFKKKKIMFLSRNKGKAHFQSKLRLSSSLYHVILPAHSGQTNYHTCSKF